MDPTERWNILLRDIHHSNGSDVRAAASTLELRFHRLCKFAVPTSSCPSAATRYIHDIPHCLRLPIKDRGGVCDRSMTGRCLFAVK